MTADPVADLLARIGLTPADLDPALLEVARSHVGTSLIVEAPVTDMNQLIRDRANRGNHGFAFTQENR